jgi:hypothetical protein
MQAIKTDRGKEQRPDKAHGLPTNQLNTLQRATVSAARPKVFQTIEKGLML